MEFILLLVVYAELVAATDQSAIVHLDDGISQIAGLGIALKVVSGRQIATDAAFCTNPDAAVAVLEKIMHKVAAQALSIVVVVIIIA